VCSDLQVMSLYAGLGLGLDNVNADDKAKEDHDDAAAAKKEGAKKDAKSAAKWNVNLQMMAPHLQRKRAADVAAKAAALRAKAKAKSTAGNSTAGKSGVKKTTVIKKVVEAMEASGPAAEPFIQLPAAQLEVKDEYVPSKPNDYEMWKQIFEMEEQVAEAEGQRKRGEEPRRKGGAAIAPPPSVMGEVVAAPPLNPLAGAQAEFHRGNYSGGGAAEEPPGEPEFEDPFANLPVTGYMAAGDAGPSDGIGATQPSTAAQPQAGAPLSMSGDEAWAARARKSGRAGAPPPPMPADASQASSHTAGQSGPVLYRQVPSQMVSAVCSTPSRTVLLKNMVGPGEVDDELEAETAEECSRFGAVVRTRVKELRGVPANEAVQILVQFERQEAATKAISAMNGRYFGGRVVAADYYNP